MFIPLPSPLQHHINRYTMSIYCKLILTLFPILCFSNQLFSQEHTCISESHLENNSTFNKEYQQKIAQVLANRDNNRSNDNLGLITIPVVVHVIHNTTAQNISDAQIQSQIDVLNTAFDLEAPWITAFYPQATDVDIQFVLANVDPNGNSTAGITRTHTPVGIFSIDLEQPLDWQQNTHMKLDSEGGKDAWPTDEYLNIWVINCQYYIKGFGTFPGSIASNLDGVVINYKYFGNIETGTTYINYAEGKSCVHEVGHWLDLRHVFANGDCAINDGLADTPAQENFYYSCAAPIVECGNTLMLENYMQYTYDQCQMVYTEDQSCVMRSNFLPGAYRESILTSSGYQNSGTGLSALIGNVFHDIDEDGVMDTNETLYSNIEISLYDCNDQLVDNISSDNNGYYEFLDIPSGQYYLLINENTLPAGKGPDPIWLSSNGCANIINGNNYIQDFALLNYGTISGDVWEDMNADGIMQNSEPSINNTIIKLVRSNGSIIEQINPFTNGQYTFTEVYPSDYYLEFSLDPDYQNSPEGIGNNNTDNNVGSYYGTNTTSMNTVNQGQNLQNLGAGFFQMAEVSGFIWDDSDFDGNFDGNENGEANVNVNMYNDQFILVGNTSTMSDGSYVFNEVYPGNYYFSLTPPNSMAIIPQPDQMTYFDQSNGPNTSPTFDFLSGYQMTNLNAGLGLGTVAIEDVQLSGKAMSDHIALNWSANTNNDTRELKLQKKQAQNWETIFIKSEMNILEYKDYNITNQTNYYRLVMADDLDREIISNVIAIEYNNFKQTISIQNPVTDKLYINFNNDISNQIELSIYNSQHLLQQLNIYRSELDAINQIAIDFEDYPAGIYFIRYEIEGIRGIKKIVKVQ